MVPVTNNDSRILQRNQLYNFLHTTHVSLGLGKLNDEISAHAICLNGIIEVFDVSVILLQFALCHKFWWIVLFVLKIIMKLITIEKIMLQAFIRTFILYHEVKFNGLFFCQIKKKVMRNLGFTLHVHLKI